MTRPIAPAMLAAAQADVVRPFLAVDLAYPAGAVRFNSTDRDLTLGGNVYYGCGTLGAVSAITEGAENRSYGFTLDISGVDPSFNAYLRTQDVQGRSAIVYYGFVSADYSVIGFDVITVGRMDTQDVSAGATTAIRVSCESIQVDWERARIRRCTDVDHRAVYPADGFFKYTSALENIALPWGKA